MHKRIINGLLLAVLTSFSISLFADTLNIAGSTTVKNTLLDANIASIRLATGLEIKALGNGTGKGMLDLLEGKVSVSAASETLEEAVDAARKAATASGKKIDVPSGLQFHQLKLDSLVVIVNKGNKIDSLSKEQLKKIFTGEITNWKEVGGPDMPIKVITSEAGSGTRSVFQRLIMDDADYAKGALEARNARDELFAVAKNPGAIGAIGEDVYWRSPGAGKVVQTPAIKRPLGLITAGNPNPDVQKLLDFFKSAAGKKLAE
jgi:phosphate transport system substrate-binding protein